MTPSFPSDYPAARAAFLDAARKASAHLDTIVHPDKGLQGEELAIDLAWLGPRDAHCVLVSVSGTHGVEGLYGNGCQVGWLQQQGSQALPPGTAVLLVHALNPHGFSYLRRVNEDNIDINRNNIDFSGALPGNPEYETIHPWLLPDQWDAPSQQELLARLMAYAQKVGMRTASRAVSGGQHTHPDGVFYGGQALCWSSRQLKRLAGDYLQQARMIAVLDHHTGLGPTGHTELICRHPVDSRPLALARQWWGADVTSPAMGESASAVVSGNVRMAFVNLCPQACVVAIAIEVGTQTQQQVRHALFADNWLYQRGQPLSAQGDAIRQQMKDAFFVDTPQWREGTFQRAMQLWQQAFDGMQSAVAPTSS
jgi:hypothetical protein